MQPAKQPTTRRSLRKPGLYGAGALAALVAVALPAQYTHAVGGATYYVATTGQDGNPCTSAAPCASFLRASSLAGPGDTVLVLPGVYGPQVITASGSPGAPVTVTANGAVTLTRPLPLTSGSQQTALLRLINSSYLVVSGFRVEGPKGQPGYDANARPYGGEVETENHVSGQPGNGLVVRGLTVEHANNTCIKVQDNEPGVSILDNTIDDCGQPGNTLDHGVYESGPNGLMQGNTINGSSGFGITVYGANVGGAQILGNTVSGAHYSGLDIEQGPGLIAGNTVYANHAGITVANGVTVANNVVVDHPGGGVVFTVTSQGVGGDSVLNNTFYQNGTDSPYESILSNSKGYTNNFTLPLTVRNNIFVSAGSGTARVFNGALPAGSTVDHNLYQGTNSAYGGVSYDRGPSLTGVDPAFVNPSASPVPDLHLRGQSPAIGAGVAESVPGITLSTDLGGLCYTCSGQSGPTATPVPPTSTPAPNPTPAPAAPASFATGFEPGQPQPTWNDSVAFAQDVTGVCCGLTHMESSPRTGEGSPHSGAADLMYSGRATGGARTYSYNQLFDLRSRHLVIGPNATLSYWIYPQAGPYGATAALSGHVAVDLLFTDGSALRDAGVTDQYGAPLHPAAQGGHFAANAWNPVTARIGAKVAGKTVATVLVGFDDPGAVGAYRGYIDDLQIANG